MLLPKETLMRLSWDGILFYPRVIPTLRGKVRKFGKPDLFITFKCNPLWDEITCSLLLNQKATDRPDLIVRVFRQKLRELLNDILK